jgi:hypothetical protein
MLNPITKLKAPAPKMPQNGLKGFTFQLGINQNSLTTEDTEEHGGMIAVLCVPLCPLWLIFPLLHSSEFSSKPLEQVAYRVCQSRRDGADE